MATLLSTVSAYSEATNFNLKKLLLVQNIEANRFSSIHLSTGFVRADNVKVKKHTFCSVRGSESAIHKTDRKQVLISKRRRDKVLLLSEGRDEDERYGLICAGCGVFLQDKDPNIPGYFGKRKVELAELSDSGETMDDLFEEHFDCDEDDDSEGPVEDDDSEDDEISGRSEINIDENAINWDSEEWEDLIDAEDNYLKELDGFTPAGVGYGNITEETVEKSTRTKVSKSEKKRAAREEARRESEGFESVTVCARCHSLRNYGRVNNRVADNLIPDFDFNRLISTRLMKPTGKADSTVVVMVVDVVDFDGSFPKRAAKSLFRALSQNREGKNLPKLVLVATKVDLLPPQVSPARLDMWVRHRARANGAPKLSGVYLVSSKKDLGVRNLLSFVKDLAGPRGNVWVVGAQNAGKSTLINAFSKKQGVKIAKLTEASVPGTTLGIIRLGGILPGKAKMYDTPGLLHPYLMSVRLDEDERKMVEIRKELQPRTFRIKAGQSIHVGCLVRLDLDEASVETIYVSVWASPSVSLHLGKIENADEIKSKHSGIRLQPPCGADRVFELGEWERTEIKASGTSWDVNSVDVAVAGLGWFSLGLKGEAKLSLWTYGGISISVREPLVLDRAKFLERPGFWLPKAISEAVGNRNRLEAAQSKKTGREDFIAL